MVTDIYLNFVVQAAKKLRTALFMDCSNGEYTFPSNLVTLLQADVSGDFFFVVRKPFSDLGAFTRPFYAQLHFFNKHLPFYITLEGAADIVSTEKAERLWLSNGVAYNPATDAMLRLHIHQATYAVQRKRRKRLVSFVRLLTNWLTSERINPWRNLTITVD